MNEKTQKEFYYISRQIENSGEKLKSNEYLLLLEQLREWVDREWESHSDEEEDN